MYVRYQSKTEITTAPILFFLTDAMRPMMIGIQREKTRITQRPRKREPKRAKSSRCAPRASLYASQAQLPKHLARPLDHQSRRSRNDELALASRAR